MTVISQGVAGARSMSRAAWFAVGLGLTAFAIFEVVKHDLGPGPILAFAILPDLAFVAGLGQPHARGQLPPRAVPLYNLTHHPLVPAAVLTATVLLPLTPFWWTAGLAWFAHIAFDRAFGYGPRTRDGWQRG